MPRTRTLGHLVPIAAQHDYGSSPPNRRAMIRSARASASSLTLARACRTWPHPPDCPPRPAAPSCVVPRSGRSGSRLTALLGLDLLSSRPFPHARAGTGSDNLSRNRTDGSRWPPSANGLLPDALRESRAVDRSCGKRHRCGTQPLTGPLATRHGHGVHAETGRPESRDREGERGRGISDHRRQPRIARPPALAGTVRDQQQDTGQSHCEAAIDRLEGPVRQCRLMAVRGCLLR